MNHLERHIHALKTARGLTLGLLNGFDGTGWFAQPVGTGQHALWIAGHLAVADDWALISLGKTARVLESLDPYFAGTTPIIADPDAYPPASEVFRHLNEAHERFMLAFGGVTEHDLTRGCSGSIAAFAPDLGTLLTSHVWHEGFHAGQLALIRRSIGLPVCTG